MKDEPSSSPLNGKNLAEVISTLEKHHVFPGPYIFKVIAYQTEDLMERVAQAARKGLGDPQADLGQRGRDSRNNRYASITLEPAVANAAQVLAVYQELKKIEGLITLI